MLAVPPMDLNSIVVFISHCGIPLGSKLECCPCVLAHILEVCEIQKYTLSETNIAPENRPPQ